MRLLVRLAASTRPLAREQVAALFWPELRGPDAGRNLRKLLFDLKSHPWLAKQPLEVDDHSVRWPIDTDAKAFEEALAGGRLADALDLLTGQPLDGLDGDSAAFDEWLRAERHHWWNRWLDALRRAAAEPTLRDRLGRWLTCGLSVDPLDEWLAKEQVAWLLAHEGQVPARRAYLQWAERVRGELGIESSFEFPTETTPSAGRPASEPVAPSPAGMSTTFIGRRGDLAALHRLFGPGGARWVSLLGPPGVGKTRLALQWAGEARVAGLRVVMAWLDALPPHDAAEGGPRDDDGFAAASGAAATAIAQAFGLHLHGGATPRRVIDSLATVRAVLVLDNAEHRTGDRPMFEQLVARTPVSLLLTTRARFGAADEHVHPLGGLALPGPNEFPGLSVSEAEQLFADRASLVAPWPAGLTDAVRSVCALLAGQPLAIEIAARLSRREGVERVRDRILRDLTQLAVDAPELPERQQRLDVAFKAGFDALPVPLRAALARLTVLHDSFEPGMAAEVAEVPSAMLSALVDRSLLSVDPAGGRLHWHPFAHEFARRHAGLDQDAIARARSRLVRHVAERLSRLGADEVRATPEGLAWMKREWAHLASAWQAAVDDGHHEDWWPLADAIGMHHEVQARYREGAALLVLPAAALVDERAGREAARVAVVRARLEHWLDNDQARRTLDEVQPWLIQWHDEATLAAALRVRGLVEWRLGHAERALEVQAHALALAERHGLAPLQAIVLDGIGLSLVALRRLSEAGIAFSRALAMNESALVDNPCQTVQNLINLALLRRHAEPVAAQALASRALELVRFLGDVHYEPHVLTTMGLALMAQGRDEAAAEVLQLAIRQTQRSGDAYVESWAQSVLADVLTRRALWADARRAIRRGLELSSSMGDLALIMFHLGAAARMAAALGERTWATRMWSVVAGAPQSRGELLDEALSHEGVQPAVLADLSAFVHEALGWIGTPHEQGGLAAALKPA